MKARAGGAVVHHGPRPAADADRRGQHADDVAGAYRFLVNANKYVTSIGATDAARRGIEVLGGNGTIEDFSPCPASTATPWSSRAGRARTTSCAPRCCGTAAASAILDDLLTWLRAELATTSDTGPDMRRRGRRPGRPRTETARSVGDAGHGAAHFRRQLELLTRAPGPGDVPAHRDRCGGRPPQPPPRRCSSGVHRSPATSPTTTRRGPPSSTPPWPATPA